MRSALASVLAGWLAVHAALVEAQTEDVTAVPAEGAAETPASEVETIPVPPLRSETPADTVEKPTQTAVQLDTIEVTAGKRRQTLRDIPGSVAALRGDELEKMKAQNLGDYLKRIPGVILVERGADDSQPIMRGITTSTSPTTTVFTQLPVGIYVDDMPFTDLYVPFSQPDLNPFDLERVEILKGPQGTLFGSGALSGAIRYILQKPRPAIWEGKLSATVMANHEGEGLSPVYGAALNVPVYEDRAALRVAGVWRENTGMIDELPSGREDIDTLQQATGRVLGHWQVTDRFKLDGFYFHQETDQQNSPDADNQLRFERSHDDSVLRESGFTGGNLVATYNFDNFDFLSSSNLQRKKVVNNSRASTGVPAPEGGDPDGEGGANGPGTEDAGLEGQVGYINSATDGLFQEFRLSSPDGADWEPFNDLSVRWLTGLAYQQARQDVDQYTALAALQDGFNTLALIPILPIATPVGPLYGSREASLLYAELHSKAQETAIFGELTAALYEDWELTLGARIFKTKLHATGFLTGAQIIALDPGSLSVPIDRTIKEDGVNPKISLRYVLNSQLQFYALVAKGFQFGGVQLNPELAAFGAAAAENFKPFLSSTLWNYEVGFRSEFYDRRLKWDTTLFYMDWTDMQITQRKPLVPGGETANLTVGVIQNIGSAKSRGVESSLSVSPFKGLDFTTGVAWIQAETAEDFDSAEGFVAEGTRLPASPHFQMSNVLSYSAPFSLLGEWQGGVSLSHTHFGSAYNDLKYSRVVGGYDTIDCNVSLAKTDLSFAPELTLSLINLTDVRGISAATVAQEGRNESYYFTRPRTAMLSLALRF